MSASGMRSLYTPCTQSAAPASAAMIASRVVPMCATVRRPWLLARSAIARATSGRRRGDSSGTSSIDDLHRVRLLLCEAVDRLVRLLHGIHRRRDARREIPADPPRCEGARERDRVTLGSGVDRARREDVRAGQLAARDAIAALERVGTVVSRIEDRGDARVEIRAQIRFGVGNAEVPDRVGVGIHMAVHVDEARHQRRALPRDHERAGRGRARAGLRDRLDLPVRNEHVAPGCAHAGRHVEHRDVRDPDRARARLAALDAHRRRGARAPG